MHERAASGFCEYPIERQSIHWQTAGMERWHFWIDGVATGYGEFRIPETGVYVIAGRDELRRVVEGQARAKVIRSLGLSPKEAQQ